MTTLLVERVGNQALNVIKRLEKNELIEILKEQVPLDEKLTAIYLRALQRDYFDFYHPVSEPFAPHGWVDAYALYKSAKDSEKSSLWRSLTSDFAGYLKAMEESREVTASHKKFLEEMLAHFERLKMAAQCEIVRKRLREFFV